MVEPAGWKFAQCRLAGSLGEDPVLAAFITSKWLTIGGSFYAH